MSLSCDCSGDYDWHFEIPEAEFFANSRSRCYGCRKEICIGDEVRHVLAFEFDEYGDETDHNVKARLCETCSGLYDRFIELGFCIEADWGFITQALRDYQEFLPQRHILKRRT